MNLIKNIFMILTLSLLCITQGFASSEKWENNSVYSEEFDSLISLTIFENGLGEKNIGILFPSDDCDTYKSTPMKAPSMNINGTKVQMYAQCTAKGIRMDFPKTATGTKYVVSELKNKGKVKYKQGEMSVTFSATGFTNTYNNFESTSGGL